MRNFFFIAILIGCASACDDEPSVPASPTAPDASVDTEPDTDPDTARDPDRGDPAADPDADTPLEVTPDTPVDGLDASSDADTPPAVACPDGPFAGTCAFGLTSSALLASGALTVELEATHTTAETFGEVEGRQLLHGFRCEGIFAPTTVAQALELIDDDGVRVYRITRLDNDDEFIWLRFYQGDTEVGFIFADGTFELVARVSDQDVVDCTEE